jgi:hypothetical protein
MTDALEQALCTSALCIVQCHRSATMSTASAPRSKKGCSLDPPLHQESSCSTLPRALILWP